MPESEEARREQVKEFFDRMEQDPRTPAELDAIQAQAWTRPRMSREETLTELARMEAEGDAFYVAHPEIDPDEPHAVRGSAVPAPVGDDHQKGQP